MVERPFIRFKHEVVPHEIKAHFDNLSASKQRLFRSFTGNAGYQDKLVDIAETNALQLPSKNLSNDDEREWGGICKHICRINHSCRPNAGWSWDDERGEMCKHFMALLTRSLMWFQPFSHTWISSRVRKSQHRISTQHKSPPRGKRHYGRSGKSYAIVDRARNRLKISQTAINDCDDMISFSKPGRHLKMSGISMLTTNNQF